MSRETGSRSSAPKEDIPDEHYDPRIEFIVDVKGKIEKVKFLDLDLTEQVLFMLMNIFMF
jgi:hypothetical protein